MKLLLNLEIYFFIVSYYSQMNKRIVVDAHPPRNFWIIFIFFIFYFLFSYIFILFLSSDFWFKYFFYCKIILLFKYNLQMFWFRFSKFLLLIWDQLIIILNFFLYTFNKFTFQLKFQNDDEEEMWLSRLSNTISSSFFFIFFSPSNMHFFFYFYKLFVKDVDDKEYIWFLK